MDWTHSDRPMKGRRSFSLASQDGPIGGPSQAPCYRGRPDRGYSMALAPGASGRYDRIRKGGTCAERSGPRVSRPRNRRINPAAFRTDAISDLDPP